MNTGDWITAATGLVQAAAILAAGAWAYFKFVRGRTFARRAELGVTGELFQYEDARAIRAKVSLRNTGAKDIPLRVKAIFVYAIEGEAWADDHSPAWKKVAVEPVFGTHASIEAQEAVSDEVLIPIPNQVDGPLAYRLELRVFDRREKPGATEWTSEAIVPYRLQTNRQESTISEEAAVTERGG